MRWNLRAEMLGARFLELVEGIVLRDRVIGVVHGDSLSGSGINDLQFGAGLDKFFGCIQR